MICYDSYIPSVILSDEAMQQMLKLCEDSLIQLGRVSFSKYNF